MPVCSEAYSRRQVWLAEWFAHHSDRTGHAAGNDLRIASQEYHARSCLRELLPDVWSGTTVSEIDIDKRYFRNVDMFERLLSIAYDSDNFVASLLDRLFDFQRDQDVILNDQHATLHG
jgi:hypothetical protein